MESAEIGYRAPLLPPLSLAVPTGVRLAVLGPNGGGKSTLLKSLIGLLPLLSGRRILGRDGRLRIGYVPQAYHADPVYPLTAWQVVLQGRYGRIGIGRFPKKVDRLAASAELEKVGLSESARAPFRSLSGGQRQRVLLARALCGEPDLLVLDEFTSELDPAASSKLLGEVSAVTKGTQTSLVFVTHEISAAAVYSMHVALIDARRGFFESGPTRQLLTGERLSRLYGQSVSIEQRDGRTVVFVEAGGEP